jgi:hypothetical protein
LEQDYRFLVNSCQKQVEAMFQCDAAHPNDPSKCEQPTIHAMLCMDSINHPERVKEFNTCVKNCDPLLAGIEFAL